MRKRGILYIMFGIMLFMLYTSDCGYALFYEDEVSSIAWDYEDDTYEIGGYNGMYTLDQREFTEDERILLNLVNEARAKAGVPKLEFNNALRKCAIAKAKDIVKNNYFAHNSPVYGSPFDMMKQFKIWYRNAGENLAGSRSIKRAFDALMDSEDHRKNILNKKFNYVGFGIVHSPRYGKVIVQHFIGV